MILPDVNVLVHAHNSDSAVHEPARRWWDQCLAGTEGVGLAWVVMLGFVRITTHPRVLLRPLPVGDVLDRIESWLRLPHGVRPPRRASGGRGAAAIAAAAATREDDAGTAPRRSRPRTTPPRGAQRARTTSAGRGEGSR